MKTNSTILLFALLVSAHADTLTLRNGMSVTVCCMACWYAGVPSWQARHWKSAGLSSACKKVVKG